jgi:enoyl reductase-like protein
MVDFADLLAVAVADRLTEDADDILDRFEQAARDAVMPGRLGAGGGQQQQESSGEGQGEKGAESGRPASGCFHGRLLEKD